MATVKSYTDLEQSKKLAEILPLESADMVLPFRHTKNDEYIPGYVASRNYVEVYTEIAKLPGMEKEDVCKLIQPVWSLAALLSVLPKLHKLQHSENGYYCSLANYKYVTEAYNNPIDACYEMIIKLKELKML